MRTTFHWAKKHQTENAATAHEEAFTNCLKNNFLTTVIPDFIALVCEISSNFMKKNFLMVV